MRKSLRAFLICSFVLSGIVYGQGLGELVGAVSDPSGAVIAGAKVTATEIATRFSRSVTTNAEGFYTITSLRPADYNLTVEAQGFRTHARSGVTLAADQSATVNVRLEVGAAAESISVNADSVQVDTSTDRKSTRLNSSH